MASDARLLIGHCRWATQGDPGEAINNHPHPCDGGWLVHNGVVSHYHELIQQYKLHPVSRCDSEVIALLVEKEDGNHLQRACRAVLKVRSQPLVVLGLWRAPQRLVAIRNGNPLHMGCVKEGTYLASLAEGLPGRVSVMKDGQGVDFAACPPSQKTGWPAASSVKVKATSTVTPNIFDDLVHEPHW
jgi:glucosamine 6-phosphate synthetase-like amidotransferase/phosphosugar isomerase protein